MKPWLDCLVDGRVEVPLISVALLGKAERRYEGSGQMVWTDNESIRLQVITNGDDSLNGIPHNQIGKLLDKDDLIQLEGATHDLHSVIIENIIDIGSMFNGSGMRVWDKFID